jgi:hypothetical protein
MDDAVSRFWTGNGGADAVARPLVSAGYARLVRKGVYVRALAGNGVTIYVGNAQLHTGGGYPLVAGEEVFVPVDSTGKVYVQATPSGNTSCVATVSGDITGDTFVLTIDGVDTATLSTDAAAATVQTAVLAVVGAGNATVSGDAGGPYTIEFVSALAKTDVTVTGTGYGVNETQNITVTDGAAGDKLVITYGEFTTAPIDYDSTSAEVQAALEAVFTAGNVSVTDGTTGWDVEFIGDLALTPMDAMTGVCGKNELQSISIDLATAGTFTLTYVDQTTGAIAYNASAATVATALKALSNIGDSDVVVTGNAGGPWSVEFTGDLAMTDVAALTATESCGVDEEQTVTVTDATDGTFTLTYSGQTTGNIAYNAAAADVATALKALSNIGDSDVSVSGDAGGPWTVSFVGTLAYTNVAEMTADGTNLVGTGAAVAVATTVVGSAATVTITEEVAGNEAIVTVTESQAGDAGCIVSVVTTSASAGSLYAWLGA